MFILIFEQLIKMFFIMVLAFVCYRIGLVSQEGNKSVSNLLLLIVNPILILTVYQTKYEPDLVRGLLLAFVAAVIFHLLGIVLSTILIRTGSSDYGIDRFNSMYSNCGFVGIPLVSSVLGNNGVFFLTAYMAIFNLFSWTHGIFLMEKKCSLKNLKDGVRSPMFIATVAAIVLFFARIHIPSVLLDSMNYIADMNTPLAMMVAGFSVAQANLPRMFRNLRLYYVCGIKLLLLPLCTIPVLMLLPLSPEVSMTILIAAACPCATTSIMMAIRYNQNYTYASESFSMSTVLSVITLPVVVLIAEYFLL